MINPENNEIHYNLYYIFKEDKERRALSQKAVTELRNNIFNSINDG